MSNLVLFDNGHIDLLPLTFTRPVAELRIGILTITQKWERFFNTKASFFTQDYLKVKFPLELGGDNLLISGNVLPEELLVSQIKELKLGEGINYGDEIVCARLNLADATRFLNGEVDAAKMKTIDAEPITIRRPYDIFRLNGVAIELDFKQVTAGRKSAPLSPTNRAISPENIFIEEGAVVECAILNASTGSIYIGVDAEIMEGSIVRGPLALCEHAGLKMGAKIYGPTTIGPHSKVGGEVNNSVITGYSNKGHDGFLGNSVLGEWCNLGADTNNSNLKNNYEEVKLWSYREKSFVKTGLQFCGLIMGDHSKCGINTMFNTGTVVGVSANIFGTGFPRNIIPSFSWGGPHGIVDYTVSKALQTAKKVMERRGIELSAVDIDILTHIHDTTEKIK